MVTALLAPLVATVVAGAFALSLGRQYARRRRPHALAWCVALALFGVGTAAIALGIGAGWHPSVFAVYWLSGALLTVPFLAVGQLHLLAPRQAVLWWTVAGLFTVWALFAVGSNPMDVGALRAADARGGIPIGADVYGEDGLAVALLRPANYAAVIVVAGSLWSGVRTRRWGVLLIALGVVLAGASFAFVRAGRGELVSVFLAVGVTTMYAGFLAAGKPSRRRARRPADRTSTSA